ncbi:MAG: flagellar filament capping protein FliD, partial [Clostridiales bacterium]|nr:flagellar filament capping protein FliD [Clostridiales bacterium]
KYNTVVDNIETKLTEKKDSDYSPLTDSQKSEMTTSQITAWETKAKVGILRNDDNLEKMLSDLRTAFTTAVSNAGYSLGTYGSNSIGIDTSYDIDTPAHIDISDASKLKTAITSNPDQVLKLFTNVSTTKAPTASDGTTKYDSSTQEYQEDGIFTRIKSILEKNVGYTNVTLNTATLTSFANKQYDYSSTGTGGKGTLPDQLYEQELKVKDVTSEMSTMQEKYYNQFSQLETVMTELNAQQSELSSLLGS